MLQTAPLTQTSALENTALGTVAGQRTGGGGERIQPVVTWTNPIQEGYSNEQISTCADDDLEDEL